MAYLDLSESVRYEVLPHSRFTTQLQLFLSSDGLARLMAHFDEVYRQSGAELRLVLSNPPQWTLFWKVREESSRILLAHPGPDEWVATFALEPLFVERFLLALKDLKGDDSIRVSQFGELESMSNLDLVISLQGG